jgi:hypothetical protein
MVYTSILSLGHPSKYPAAVSQYAGATLALVSLADHEYFLKAFPMLITNRAQVC